MLHDLDIQDKHRDILTVSADIQGFDLGGSFEYEDLDTPPIPSLDMYSDIKFGDGVVLGTIHAGAPIRMVSQMILRPAMRVQITYRDTTYDVMPILEQFVAETRRYLDILLFGLAPPDDEEWSPMRTGPPQA